MNAPGSVAAPTSAPDSGAVQDGPSAMPDVRAGGGLVDADGNKVEECFLRQRASTDPEVLIVADGTDTIVCLSMHQVVNGPAGPMRIRKTTRVGPTDACWEYRNLRDIDGRVAPVFLHTAWQFKLGQNQFTVVADLDDCPAGELCRRRIPVTDCGDAAYGDWESDPDVAGRQRRVAKAPFGAVCDVETRTPTPEPRCVMRDAPPGAFLNMGNKDLADGQQ